MAEFPTSAEQLPNDEPNPDPTKYHRWPMLDMPSYLPAEKHLHARSPADVFGMVFERKKLAYSCGERLVADALAMAFAVYSALAHDLKDLGVFTGTIQDFDMQLSAKGETPEKGQGVVFNGHFYWEKQYPYESCPCYEVVVTFPMMLKFKLNTIREYVIAKLLACGDTEAQPVGVLNDPLLGRFAPDASAIKIESTKAEFVEREA